MKLRSWIVLSSAAGIGLTIIGVFIYQNNLIENFMLQVKAPCIKDQSYPITPEWRNSMQIIQHAVKQDIYLHRRFSYLSFYRNCIDIQSADLSQYAEYAFPYQSVTGLHIKLYIDYLYKSHISVITAFILSDILSRLHDTLTM